MAENEVMLCLVEVYCPACDKHLECTFQEGEAIRLPVLVRGPREDFQEPSDCIHCGGQVLLRYESAQAP